MKEKNSIFQPPINTLAIILIFPLLAGCAGSQLKRVPHTEAIDEISNITSVALLQIPEPQYKFGESIRSGAASSLTRLAEFFGDVAVLAAAVNSTAETVAFINADATSIYGDDFKFSEQMHNILSASLQQSGLEVMVMQVTRNKPSQVLGSYDGLSFNIDAYLDIVPNSHIGYQEIGGKIYPVLTAHVRLVSAKSKEVLFEDRFFYGRNNPFMDTIEAPEEHIYETKIDLEKNKNEAIDRLIAGVSILGSEILHNISPRWDPVQFNGQNQLSSEKVGSISDSNKHEQPALSVGVTGTYSSTITGTTAQSILGINPEVKLIQKGKKISGTYGTAGGEISGEIEDGNIKFKYHTPRGGFGSGKWTVEPDSGEIIGKWSSTTWHGSGKWNLKRIE